MGTLLKALAVLFVIGGLWVWASGHAVTSAVVARTDATNGSLAASAALAPGTREQGAFDQEGTIIIDPSQGSGVPYILYTAYSAGGSPSVMTKRLVFRNQDECADLNLPCATRQPGPPVTADEKVRVVGVIKDETVEVSELYRL
jgi:hypothetical protein